MPGTDQDWLTRPIPRDKLILAKLLFVALIGLGPIFVADVLMGLTEHLRVIDVVAASFTRSFVLGGVICLPAMLVGSITRSLANAIMFALVVVVVLIVELLVLTQTPARPGAAITGYAWTIVPLLIAANVVAAVALLPLQFRWRDTNRVRWLLGAYLCVLPAAAFLPWTVAYKMQQALDSRQEPAFSLSLDTAKPVAYSSLDARLPPRLRGHASSVMVAVPMIVSPVLENETWRVDQLRIRAVGPGLDESIGSWNQFPLANASVDPAGRLAFNIPSDIFNAARERRAEIQVTVYLTSFRRVVKRAVASLDGGSIDGFSVCRRGTDPYDRTIQCVSTRLVGVCMIIDDPNWEAPKSASTHLALFQCGRKYEPWPLPLWRDPYYSIRIPDPPWNMTDTAQSSEAPDPTQSDPRILSNYLPNSHFTRSLSFEIAAAERMSPRSESTSRSTVSALRRASSRHRGWSPIATEISSSSIKPTVSFEK